MMDYLNAFSFRSPGISPLHLRLKHQAGQIPEHQRRAASHCAGLEAALKQTDKAFLEICYVVYYNTRKVWYRYDGLFECILGGELPPHPVCSGRGSHGSPRSRS